MTPAAGRISGADWLITFTAERIEPGQRPRRNALGPAVPQRRQPAPPEPDRRRRGGSGDPALPFPLRSHGVAAGAINLARLRAVRLAHEPPKPHHAYHST